MCGQPEDGVSAVVQPESAPLVEGLEEGEEWQGAVEQPDCSGDDGGEVLRQLVGHLGVLTQHTA